MVLVKRAVISTMGSMQSVLSKKWLMCLITWISGELENIK